ncbi:MAG: SAM-dependent chlorinase/fluorinase [Gammaproteobacteria bacterium]|jgi:S-adenosylmethionine hydrolase
MARRFVPTLVLLVIASAASAAPASDARVIEGSIVGTGSGYGNLQTDIPASAMTLDQGEKFTFACKEGSFQATWVSWYSDVPEGEWLGLPGEEGRVQMAISFGDADVASGCGRGDPVRLTLPTSPG